MRIKQKPVPERELTDRIINEALICHLACSLEDQPYVIPLGFGYDGQTVYFHTSRNGKKIDIFENNPRVCLSFEANIKLIADQENACGWNFHYQSVIATGKIKEILNPERKKNGLNQIMQHYSGREWEMPDKEIKKTKIWGVRLEKITEKSSPSREME